MRRFDITVTDESVRPGDDRAYQSVDQGPARTEASTERAYQSTDAELGRGRHADGAIAPLAD